MPARKTITAEDVKPFIPQLQSRQLTRAQLAEQLGVCLSTLRRELKSLAIAVPTKRNERPLHERLLELFTDEELQTLSQSEIASRLNITQPNITTALRKLGIKRVVHNHTERDALCEQVVNHIVENGGYVESTIRELGINIYKNAVYNYCKDNDIDLRLYRFAHRKYGHWLTLPCIAERIHTCDYKIKAMCTKCGTVHYPHLVNMKNSASTQCLDCASKERGGCNGGMSVRCVDTDETFSSVRSLSKAIGASYQKILLLLKRDGSFEHNGLTYRLPEAQ
jgi:DNA-binding transcriptional ArsR family regulator